MAAAPGFEALVSPHLPDLRRYCLYLTGSAWDAEDLYQEALLKAYVYVRKKEQGQVTKSFLLGAARLLWIDACRKRKRRAGGASPADAVTDADYAEIRGWIEWLAERMPARHLEMWMLAEYFGYSMQDIAERLETSVSAVKSALHRTKSTLRGGRPHRRPDAGPALQGAVDRWARAVLREAPQKLTV